jgi:ATP-dependent helicase HrpB
MRELPVDRCLPMLVSALRTERRAVLIAPPGAGKSTRVPPAILDHGLLPESHPAVVLLQPRRIAARATAARIAEERGAILGEEVGYHVRFERRRGPRTRLVVATEGVLNRQILADPFLEGVGAVILDEFHERSLHTDLALAFLNEIREAAREDLLLVVMSATLDPEPVARFLGGCPVIRADAPAHPVDIEYAPRAGAEPLADHVASVLERTLKEVPGDILVFLPGMEEIRRTARRVEPLARRTDLAVLPLHGGLPAQDQDRALRPSDRRKVILATNVAETSLTIEGIRTVIDTGLARFAGHDPARGLDRLELRRISRASADQRAGRAGRTGPGRCVRLWSQREERGMPPFDEPEIRRVDLAPTLLAVHAWGCSDLRRFGWFEPPPSEAIESAESTLTMLGALDEARRTITPLGRKLSSLPAHPRIARLMVEAARIGRLEQGASLAAILSERDILARSAIDGPPARPPDQSGGESDLLARLDLLEQAERRGVGPALRSWGLDPGAVRRVIQARQDLLRTLRGLSRGPTRPHDDPSDEWLLKLPLLAYPDRVCRRRESDPRAAMMVGGRGVRLDPGSVVRENELFLALDARDDRRSASREALVRIASAIRPEWLEELFPGSTREVRETRYDAERQRVVGLVATYYRDLRLSERPGAAVDPDQAGALLAAALADRAETIFRQQDACARWLDRVACLGSWMPELGLPRVNPAFLAGCLERACQGCKSAAEVARQPLLAWLQAVLAPAQQRQLDELAPETIRVPSGSRIRLVYEPGRPPVLAVRIQELFGWRAVPRVASGRVPVLLHLLAPNFRPVQITDDLESFWRTTYARVRKELRARYPKHRWPEDPLTAEPAARPGRAPDR